MITCSLLAHTGAVKIYTGIMGNITEYNISADLDKSCVLSC